jgi:hypothetical protein
MKTFYGTDRNGNEYYDENSKVSDADGNIITGKIIFDNDDEAWFMNGKLHNEAGPAYTTESGDKYYMLYGAHINLEGITGKELEKVKREYPKLYNCIVQDLAERYL